MEKLRPEEMRKINGIGFPLSSKEKYPNITYRDDIATAMERKLIMNGSYSDFSPLRILSSKKRYIATATEMKTKFFVIRESPFSIEGSFLIPKPRRQEVIEITP
ncbi:MAG: hypothetical protein HXS54_08515 [Theionarchaea archaeon]|nr:hypothetical protein [Theionarchaea archaeon]